MRLSEAYGVSGSSDFNIKYFGPINESRYPKNIILHFNGIAHVRVYVDEVLIEEGLSESKYIMSNFRNVAFPYELYPKLSFDVDIPYIISYVETQVSSVSKQFLLHKTVTYQLVNHSYRKTLIFKQGEILYKVAVPNTIEDLDNEYLPVESYDWQKITESYSYSYVNRYVMFMYGMPYDLYILEKYDDHPVPCVLIKRTAVLRFIDELKTQYPKARFQVSDERPTKLIKKHKAYLNFVLNTSRERKLLESRRLAYDNDRDVRTPILEHAR